MPGGHAECSQARELEFTLTEQEALIGVGVALKHSEYCLEEDLHV